jgi:hypothetical protein
MRTDVRPLRTDATNCSCWGGGLTAQNVMSVPPRAPPALKAPPLCLPRWEGVAIVEKRKHLYNMERGVALSCVYPCSSASLFYFPQAPMRRWWCPGGAQWHTRAPFALVCQDENPYIYARVSERCLHHLHHACLPSTMHCVAKRRREPVGTPLSAYPPFPLRGGEC